MTTAHTTSGTAEIANLSVHELNVRIIDDIINTRNNVPPFDAQLRQAMLDELHGRALADTCGRPWVAEIQSCPRCHRPAFEHPERTADPVASTAVPVIPHVQVPVKIPARELRKGDKISMGVIDAVTLHERYVSIRFESRIGFHGTAFPLDLEVTVLNRRPVEVEVDVVAELTALADRWDRSGTRRKADAANHRIPQHEVGGMIAEGNQLRHCAHQLRELLARLQA